MNDDTFLETTLGLVVEAPFPFIIADREARTLWANPAFVGMCGHELEELVGRKPGEVLQGPDSSPMSVEMLRLAVAKPNPCTVTMVNYHKSGRAYWVQIFLYPIHNERGELRYFCALELELKANPAAAAFSRQLQRAASCSVRDGFPGEEPEHAEGSFTPAFDVLTTPQLESLCDDLLRELRKRNAATLRDDYVAVHSPFWGGAENSSGLI